MSSAAVPLTEQIRDRYHEAHERDLQLMRELAYRLDLLGLAREIETLEDMLEVHLFREEVLVFPKMRSSAGRAVLRDLLDAMDEEHRRIDAAARSLAASILSLAPLLETSSPEDAALLLETGRRFLDELTEHRAMEDEELFPLFGETPPD